MCVRASCSSLTQITEYPVKLCFHEKSEREPASGISREESFAALYFEIARLVITAGDCEQNFQNWFMGHTFVISRYFEN